MLKILIISLLFVLCGNTLSKGRQYVEQMRAVKITNVDSDVLFSDKSIEEAVDYLASIGINAILPVTWNAAKTQFPSSTMQSYFGLEIDPRMKNRDPFKRILIEAHRHGMEVYPWFEYGFAAWFSGESEANGGPILSKYPSWATLDRDGNLLKKNGFDWINGLNPDVQRFINSLVLEMVDTYDLDGVEFSDRIPAMPVEAGYDSLTVRLYKQEHQGESPPFDFKESAWKRWRANKLSDFYEDLKDSVKKRDNQLIIATSPSLYPWGYEEYLQDNVEWVNHNIVDHYIPQLYRYTISDYSFELNKTINQTLNHKREMIFAGILMNVGNYKATPSFMRQILELNRSKGLLGEAFFFYEGFKKDGGELGELLKNEFYQEEAIVPLRNGQVRRPKASIVKGKTIKPIDWELAIDAKDFDSDSLWLQSSQSSTTSLSYTLKVPVDAYYDVYYYNQSIQNESFATSVDLTVKSISLEDSSLSTSFRSNQYGWTYLTQVKSSELTVELSISNPQGGKLFAPSIMAVINRKKSPHAEILNTSISKSQFDSNQLPGAFKLLKIFPNPFNPSTTIEFVSPKSGKYSYSIISTLGQVVKISEPIFLTVGDSYSMQLNFANQASGVYFIALELDGTLIESKALTLIK